MSEKVIPRKQLFEWLEFNDGRMFAAQVKNKRYEVDLDWLDDYWTAHKRVGRMIYRLGQHATVEAAKLACERHESCTERRLLLRQLSPPLWKVEGESGSVQVERHGDYLSYHRIACFGSSRFANKVKPRVYYGRVTSATETEILFEPVKKSEVTKAAAK